MNDIVNRLRRKTVAGKAVFPSPLDNAAANEIERLRGLLREARHDLYGWAATYASEAADVTAPLISRIDAALAGAADQPKAARTPAEDACMDIFNDWDESEIKDRSRSVQYAWEAGRQLQEAMRAADPTLPIP